MSRNNGARRLARSHLHRIGSRSQSLQRLLPQHPRPTFLKRSLQRSRVAPWPHSNRLHDLKTHSRRHEVIRSQMNQQRDLLLVRPRRGQCRSEASVRAFVRPIPRLQMQSMYCLQVSVVRLLKVVPQLRSDHGHHVFRNVVNSHWTLIRYHPLSTKSFADEPGGGGLNASTL